MRNCGGAVYPRGDRPVDGGTILVGSASHFDFENVKVTALEI